MSSHTTLDLPLLFTVFTLIVSALYFYQRNARSKNRASLPPGPPADPLIHHLRVIPTKDHPEVYHEWSKTYGDVIFLSALGHSFVVLATEEAAVDLMEKRSANYSNRPKLPMHELIGWTDMLVFLDYGEQFHKMRRLSQQPFTRQGSLVFRDIQLQHAHILLHNLLVSPEEFVGHAHRFATGIIMDITYGHRIISNDDPYLQMADRVSRIAFESGNFGTNLVDIFPILKNLPAWFPGAWFIRWGQGMSYFTLIQQMRDWPFKEVQEQMAAGNAKISFLSMHLEEFAREGINSPEEFEDLKIAASLFNQAAGETTSSAILLFILAMLRHPEAQEKARNEIDRVVGRDRLPDFSDRESLPMVECVIRETFRLYHPLPLGVPHCSTADDVYKGMFIPKGTIVVANSVSMGLNERVYAHPHEFWPERYLPKPIGNGEPYLTSAFGFGRRICPGRFLGDASLWISIANMLAAFHIAPILDDKGNPLIPPNECDTGATRWSTFRTE
ncbi:hypothetical protein NLI96_g262 [Meripilus lineatus]|uniref:Cytochrome P450 n=1 Tax=Meripilus lineatus TaxID=2056292 RepID=A0AAD5YJI2_9APHY|nr:hypothetical protein NLI96_g262 [Physisporinus lineatus]